MPHCHWIDGSLVDLDAVSRRCAAERRRRGAGGRAPVLAVDATQSLGALPMDVSALDVDFAAASVHKWLLGPYGCSLAYVHPDHHGALAMVHDEHALAGGTSDDVLRFDAKSSRPYGADLAPGARGFDGGGRPNPVILPMVEAALDQVLEWSVDRVAATLAALTAPAVARLGRHRDLRVARARAPGLFGVRPRGLDGRDADAWAEAAAAALKARKILVTGRFGAVRVGAYLYNTPADLDALCGALEAFAEAWAPGT